METEHIEKLERKYAAQAVCDANGLHDANRRIDASLKVMAELRDPNVELRYKKDNLLYKAARTVLLGTAITLAAVTTYAVHELQLFYRDERQQMQQQIVALEQKGKRKDTMYGTLETRFESLSRDHKTATDNLAAKLRSLQHMTEQLTGCQQIVSDARMLTDDVETHRDLNKLHARRFEVIVKDMKNVYRGEQ